FDMFGARGARPARARWCAWWNWSSITGSTTCGTPARSAAAVVPEPTRWTATATRGKSARCGASRTAKKPSGSASPSARGRAGDEEAAPRRARGLGEERRRALGVPAGHAAEAHVDRRLAAREPGIERGVERRGVVEEE